MKKHYVIPLLGVAAVLALFFAPSRAAEPPQFQTFEYGTIRWAGREHTHFIRPNGQIEFLGPILTKTARPDRVDDRAFYLTLAMNMAAKEGFEFVGMNNDAIVLRRSMNR